MMPLCLGAKRGSGFLRSSNGGTVTQCSEGHGGCTNGPHSVGRVSEGVITASEVVVSVSELIVRASKAWLGPDKG